MKSVAASVLILLATAANAATLPGFRVQKLGATKGFCTSVAVDSHGAIFYTTQNGHVFRLADNATLATVTTDANSNSGLLGMALADDNTAIVHYTTIAQTYDVLAKIDLATGVETAVHKFVADIDVPERGSPPEHHGGIPSIGADGSIVVGIGDYGGGMIASLPQWNGGKIYRITPSGDVIQWARGMRNPYGVLWDNARQRVIVADNGANTGDALFVLDEGANCGWPFSFGGQPPIDGVTAPVYFFPQTIAPTGIIELNGANPQLRHGILFGGFVSKAIHFVPDIDARPLPTPILLIDHEVGSVISIAQSPNGDIVFATGNAVYRLIVPQRGDCNGDGLVNFDDVLALERELADAPESTYNAQNGAYAGSWGCDANGDGTIDARDLDELVRMTGFRRRSVRSMH